MSQSITYNETSSKRMETLKLLWGSFGFSSAVLGIVWNLDNIKGTITFICATIFFMVQGYYKFKKWAREDKRDEKKLRDELSRK